MVSSLSDFGALDSSRLDEEITDESIADPVGYEPGGDWLLVRPVKTNTEKTKGGIYIPDSTRGDINFVHNVGRILDFGPRCYKTKEGNMVEWFKSGLKVGDIIQWERYTGKRIRYKGVALVLLKDTAVQGKVENQHDLDALVAIE